MIKIYFDGGCIPMNPGGVATWGYALYNENELIDKVYGAVGEGDGMTNNVAEYNGLLAALKHVQLFNQKEKLLIIGDSKLVVETIGKRWGWQKTQSGKILGWKPHKDHPHLRELAMQIMDILDTREYETQWIPREQNTECDELSNLAYRAWRTVDKFRDSRVSK